MLILPHSCFVHVPKTGGSWVRRAIIASSVEWEDYSVNGDPHVGFKSCPRPGLFRFAFVRHPVSLYRSYWQYKMTFGWDTGNTLDRECQSADFHVFVRNVLATRPGAYGRTLLELVGDLDDQIEYIGKYENLTEDLIAALRKAGEVYDEDAVRNEPPANVSDKNRFSAAYTEELEAAVREAESYVLQRFNYD